MTRQRYWAPEHRSSAPDNGVDALAEVPGLHLGSLHATACGVARSARRALVRELGVPGYPGVPVQWVPSLKLPGRAARSRDRTSTGEFHGIHGILSGTYFGAGWRAPLRRRKQANGLEPRCALWYDLANQVTVLVCEGEVSGRRGEGERGRWVP